MAGYWSEYSKNWTKIRGMISPPVIQLGVKQARPAHIYITVTIRGPARGLFVSFVYCTENIRPILIHGVLVMFDS